MTMHLARCCWACVAVATIALADDCPVSRPSYNTGSGLFVLNGKLYDPSGAEVRIRGVNKNHWDQGSAGIVLAKANTVRWVIDFTRAAATNVALIQSDNVDHHIVPIPGNWTATCQTDTTSLLSAVQTWVSQAAQWTTLNSSLIVNIANEWGPSNSTVWRDSYISAIASLRAAGYTGPLLIDSGGCGQDVTDLVQYSQVVFSSDPQRNIVFALHLYGNTNGNWTSTLVTQLATLSASVGAVFIVGEFGPGRNIGPSPTLTTPGEIIQAAEANSIGWLAWAWDDNNLANCSSDDNWFSMTYHCSDYTQPSDLTIFGSDVVLNPTYGLSVLNP